MNHWRKRALRAQEIQLSLAMGSSHSSQSWLVYFASTSNSHPRLVVIHATDDAVNFMTGELSDAQKKCLRMQETVVETRIFSTPLFGAGDHAFYSTGAWHAFVCVKTPSYYWTIEKNKEGTFVQVSHSEAYVLNVYYGPDKRQIPRCHKEYLKELARDATVDVSLDSLFDYALQLAGEKYDLGSNNCKHMAQNIFNRCSKSPANILWMVLIGLDMLRTATPICIPVLWFFELEAWACIIQLASKKAFGGVGKKTISFWTAKAVVLVT